MNLNKIAIYPILIIFYLVSITQAVIDVNDLNELGGDPNILVEKILGTGIEIVPGSVIYTGNTDASGIFRFTEPNDIQNAIGLENGIILTSGEAKHATFENTSDGIEGYTNTPGDNDLNTICAGDTTLDATILEFSFRSDGSELYFDYVFASDEYNEYVDQFNDVFGFFVDGNDMGGGRYEGGTNIALLTFVEGKIDFESPDYSLGRISSQQGWVPFSYSAPPEVVSSPVLQESQSLLFDTTYVAKSICKDLDNANYQSISFFVRVDNNGSDFVCGLTDDIANKSQPLILRFTPTGDIEYYGQNGYVDVGNYSTGTPYQVTMVMDYKKDTWQLYVSMYDIYKTKVVSESGLGFAHGVDLSADEIEAFYMIAEGGSLVTAVIDDIQYSTDIEDNDAFVSINNVNKFDNPIYYNDNDYGDFGNGMNCPYDIEYDGFTDVLQVHVTNLVKGEMYHIKLAIADADGPENDDRRLDSAVFIKARSFRSRTDMIWDMQHIGKDGQDILFSGSSDGTLLDLRVESDSNGNLMPVSSGSNEFNEGIGGIWELEVFNDKLYLGFDNKLYEPNVTAIEDVNVILEYPVWSRSISDPNISSMLGTDTMLLVGTGQQALVNDNYGSQTAEIFMFNDQLQATNVSEGISASGIQCLLESDRKTRPENITLKITVEVEQGGVLGYDPNGVSLVPNDPNSDEIIYEIEYDASTQTDVNDLILTARLPRGTTFVSEGSDGAYDPSSGSVIWYLGDTEGGTYTLHLRLDEENSVPESYLKMLCWVEDDQYELSASDESVLIGCWGGPVIYVDDSNKRGARNGMSWETAFTTLEQALNHAAECNRHNQIWVAKGNYTFTGSTHYLIENVNVYGGFQGNEKYLNQRDLSGIYQTVINGAGRDYVFTGADNVIVDGFVIWGGTVGGIYCDNTSPAVSRCVITNNGSGNFENAGVICKGAAVPVLLNNFIVDNNGDGVLIAGTAAPKLRNNTIADNTGHGINNTESGNPSVYNTILWGNNGESTQYYNCSPNYCYIQGTGTPGSGNIYNGSNPFAANSYFLSPDSGCIDQGTTSAQPAISDSETDIEGHCRKIDDVDVAGVGVIDIGADEVLNQSIGVEAGEFKTAKLKEAGSGDPNAVNAVVELLDASVVFKNLVPQDYNIEWSVLDKPNGATVAFDDLHQTNTNAVFDREGAYTLALAIKSSSGNVLCWDFVGIFIEMGVKIIPYKTDRNTPIYNIYVGESLTLDADFVPLAGPNSVEWVLSSDTIDANSLTVCPTQMTFTDVGYYQMGLYAKDTDGNIVGMDDDIWINVTYPDISVNAGGDRILYLEKQPDESWQISDDFVGTVSGFTPSRMEWSVVAAEENADPNTTIISSEISPLTSITFKHYGTYYVLYKAWGNTPSCEIFLGTGVSTVTVIYREVKLDAGMPITINATEAPVTCPLKGKVVEGVVDAVQWQFCDPNAPEGLVVFTSPENLETSVIFNTVDGYSGTGTYTLTLFGKIKVDDEYMIVAADSVIVDVNIPGQKYTTTIGIETGHSGFEQGFLPQDINVWANIFEQLNPADPNSKIPFTDYDTAEWIWNGLDDSLFIMQNDKTLPEAIVRINNANNYTITLLVKKAGLTIATATLPIELIPCETELDAGGEKIPDYPDGIIYVEAEQTPAVCRLEGRILEGSVDKVQWVFNDPCAPAGLVTLTNPDQFETEVYFEAAGGYSGAGMYVFTLVGSIFDKDKQQYQIVAADSVTVDVALTNPNGGSFEPRAYIDELGNSGFDANSLPQDISVWAKIKDAQTGQEYTDYDSAEWIWGGSDGSIEIIQTNVYEPNTIVRIFKPGDYKLTLIVKKGDDVLTTAKWPISTYSISVDASADPNNWEIDQIASVAIGCEPNFYGKVNDTKYPNDITIEYYWDYLGQQSGVIFTPILETAPDDPNTPWIKAKFVKSGPYGIRLNAIDKQTRKILATDIVLVNVPCSEYGLEITGTQAKQFSGSTVTIDDLTATIIGDADPDDTCIWEIIDDGGTNAVLNEGTVNNGDPISVTFNHEGTCKFTVTGYVDENPIGQRTITVWVTSQTNEVIVCAGSHQIIDITQMAYLEDAVVISGELNYTPAWSVNITKSTSGEVTFLPNNTEEKPYVIFSEPGTYYLVLEAMNGNTGTGIKSEVRVDVTSTQGQNEESDPNVLIARFKVDGSTVFIEAQAKDNDGVKDIALILNENKVLASVSGYPDFPAGQTPLTLTYQMDITQLASGNNTFKAIGWDIYGNTGQDTAEYSNNAPIIYSFSVSPELITNVSSQNVDVHFTTSSVNGWGLEIKRGEITVLSDQGGTSGSYEKSYGTAGWVDGNYAVILTAGGQIASLPFSICRNLSPSQVVADLDTFTGTVSKTVDLKLEDNLEVTDYLQGEGETIPPQTLPVIRDGFGQISAYLGYNDDPNEVFYKLQIGRIENNSFVPLRDITPSPHDVAGWATVSSYGQDSHVLGQIDLTVLENGIYTMMLTVDCRGTVKYDTVKFVLDTQLKLGNVKFSQEDFSISVGGMPLSVIRTYDSFRKGVDSQFGKGWNFSLVDMDIQLDEERVMLKDYDGYYQESIRQYGDNFNRNVTLTLPDGQRETFMFYLEYHSGNLYNGELEYYLAKYQSPEGVNAKLETLSDEIMSVTVSADGFDMLWDGQGAQPGFVQDASFYDFRGYRLTTEDGTQYIFKPANQDYEYNIGLFDYGNTYLAARPRYGLYLSQINTPSGELITLDRNLTAIECRDSLGNQNRMIYVVYEGKHIKKIFAPEELINGMPRDPNVPTMEYAYDSGTGEYLVQVKRLVDKNSTLPKYETTNYTYEKGVITEIKDSRGLTPIQYLYDAAGRLTGTIDAKGNTIEIKHNLYDGRYEQEYGVTRTEAVTNRAGSTTIYGYDDRGRVLVMIDHESSATQYGYAGYNFTYSENGGSFAVESYTNVFADSPCVVADALGHQTYTRYDEFGKVLQTIDSALNKTVNTYDKSGNLLTTATYKPKRNESGVLADESGQPLQNSATIVFEEVTTMRNYYTSGNMLYLTGVTIGPDNAPTWHSINLTWYNPNNQIECSMQVDMDTVNDFANLFTPSGTLKNYTDSIFDSCPKTIYDYNAASNSLTQPYSVTDASGWESFNYYDNNGNQVASWSFWDNPATTGTAEKICVMNLNELDSQGRSVRSIQVTEDLTGLPDPNGAMIFADIDAYIAGKDVIIQSQTFYNTIGKVSQTIDQLGRITRYSYDELGNVVQTANYATAQAVEPLTVSRTLYDAEGRAIVSVGPYDPAVYESDASIWPCATETVYDTLGRVERTRKWASALISDFEPINGDPNNGLSLPVGVTAANAITGAPQQSDNIGWYVWDDSQKKLVVPQAGGEQSYSRTVYDDMGRVYKSYTQNEAGQEICTNRYGYDSAGRQTTVVTLPDTADQTTTVTHYDGTRRDYVVDARQNTTSFIYDALGRVIKTQHPDSVVEEGGANPVPTYSYVSYDGLGRKKWETTGPTADSYETVEAALDTKAKQYTYDSAGRLTMVKLPQVPDPENNDTPTNPTYRTIYDNYGNVVAQIDPKKRITAFAYNEHSQQTRKYQPFYDANADTYTTAAAIYNAVDSASPLSEQTAYDEFGRIAQHTDYKDQICVYEYDDLGQLEYQSWYQVAGLYNPNDPNVNAAPQIHYGYDSLGRKTTEVVKAYDSGGNQLSSEGWGYYYDADGNMDFVISPQGTVDYGYSSVTGRKTTTRVPASGDFTTTQSQVDYAYDDLGRLSTATAVKRNGQTISEQTTYGYNEVGSRASLTYGNGNFAEYLYNPLNRLASLTNYQTNAKTATLSSFGYTLYANGMRAGVTETVKVGATPTDEMRTVTYGYDTLNRLTDETAVAQSPATGNYDIDYTYDLAGNRTQRVVTATNGPNLKTTYAYDPDTDQLLTETYTEPVAAIPYGNNQRVYAYAGTGGGGITYQLPDSNHRIGQFHAFWLGLPSVVNTGLFYALMLLIPAVFFWPILQRSFRAGAESSNCALSPDLRLWHRMLCVLLAYIFLVGPEAFQTLAQADTAYSQISTLAWGQTGRIIEYGYDNNGSLTSKTTTEGSTAIETVVYDYNLQNRLVKVTTTPYIDGQPQSSTITEYAYNPDGIRVRKLVNSTTQTDYLIDSYNPTGYAQVLTETTGSDVRYYLIGDDVLSQTLNSNNPQYLLYDGHGSTRQLVASDGSTIDDSYSYDGYGVMLSNTSGAEAASGASTNLLYSGEQYDSTLDQYYLRARYYNQNNGTFNRMDDFAGNMQDPQSLHKYLYVHNNPVNNIDPSGFFSIPELLMVSLLVGVICMAVTNIVGQAKGWSVEKINEFSERAFWIGFLATAIVYSLVWTIHAIWVWLYGGGQVLSNPEVQTELHHFASNKHSYWTPRFQAIADKFNLSLNGPWNLNPFANHCGRHPELYHQWVYEQMNRAAIEAGESVDMFIILYHEYVVLPVMENPEMMYLEYWQ